MPVSERARIWSDAAGELSPAKSLARINDEAKLIAGSVTLVGSALTAVGLLAADRIRLDPLASLLSLVSVLGALVAVLIAMYSLVVRKGTINVANLREVEAWYDAQWRRADRVRFAGLLLLGAIVLGGIDSAYVLLEGSNTPPALTLQLAGSGSQAKLAAHAVVVGLPPASTVQMTVIGYAGSSSTVLARGVAAADATGRAEFTAEAPDAGQFERFRLDVTPANRSTTTLELQR